MVDGYADLDPCGRPGLGAHAHAEFGLPVIGVAKTRVPHGYPCRAGPARGFDAAVVCHRGRNPTRRSSGPSAAHGRTAPTARRDMPRRHTRTHEPGRHQTHSRAARLIQARIAAIENVNPQCGRELCALARVNMTGTREPSRLSDGDFPRAVVTSPLTGGSGFM
jgi:deoxyinosine 3'endonuclease (endonuclease V)